MGRDGLFYHWPLYPFNILFYRLDKTDQSIDTIYSAGIHVSDEENLEETPNETEVHHKQFIKDFRENSELYAKTIKKIKEILGNRVIVLADSDHSDSKSRGAIFEWNGEKIWSKIKNIAGKRGFALSGKLTGEAYGEYMNDCVKQIGENMSKTSRISIKIRSGLTEHPFQKE